jgi:mRNA-degrading endonuclease RelE of RelBE toxin-antitoxin system
VSYQVDLQYKAREALALLPIRDWARVAAKIDTLADQPWQDSIDRPAPVAPSGTCTLNVGDYRVIYTILDDERHVVVGRIARRDRGALMAAS